MERAIGGRDRHALLSAAVPLVAAGARTGSFLLSAHGAAALAWPLRW